MSSGTAIPSESSSSSVRGLANTTSEPLYQVKFLAALRSGDPAGLHPFLDEIVKSRRKSVDGDVNTAASALHLAIRCASAETVSLLLGYRAISPNGVHPVNSGVTPLHLAASLGRLDVVKLLLEQDDIDDSLRDIHGKTCKEVAKTKEIARVIEDSRSFLNASYRSLFRSYTLSPQESAPLPALIALLESPRVRFVNLSYLDDTSGRSILHEAARRKDLRLVELAVRAGVDVFVRDRKGKMAYDSAGKDDHIRAFLRQIANQDTTLIEVPSSTPPVLKGYLNKYTNVARGYGTRWFVLKAGVFSYFRHKEDESIASRGSISMKIAILKPHPGGDKLRFEVHSTPSRGHHSGVQRWFMKANHPVEASRWIQALSRSIEWYKRDAEPDTRRLSTESESSLLKPSSLHRRAMSSSLFHRKAAKSDASINSSHLEPHPDESDHGILSPLFPDSGGSGYEGESNDDGDRDDSSASASSLNVPPHDSTFDLHGNSVVAQMELTAQLFADVSLQSQSQTGEMRAALQDSFALARSMLNEYVQMVKERDGWWKTRLEKEKMSQSIWEESLASVVKEGEALEEELKKQSRKRGSRFMDDAKATIKQKPRPSPSASSAFSDEITSPTSPTSRAAAVAAVPAIEVITPTQGSIPITSPSATIKPATIVPTGGDNDNYDTDEEDEFFDAIESNTLPNLIIPKSLEASQIILAKDTAGGPFLGYTNMRTQLALSMDNRPSTSLWSVLKHSIGKDLTKISFPVFFNEPTSMLQRMAEDMEFSECLDTASKEIDPQLRIAYVAAFAMSNYSSTIGRIAKPFNPMLSETFEYVRLDKDYRYVSEQVSHHPPISACWAESPLWHYYGEVDAQNKFMGKSFEIRPTGVAHAELLIPEKWAPRYPKSTRKKAEGKVVEHYSWKKVTTNVSGFILGSPSIDHYGEMTIKNHRTGDTCLLTFKPRGWRAKDAYEIAGYVKDASGNVTYEIAGRWNSQLIARAVGNGDGSLLSPDLSVNSPTSSSNSQEEYILLWRNSEKPPAPFNLTPFAITLNDCPADTLKPYLCPTDCRLRPDQRAFERGKYELANGYKNMQEEFQRATRRAREEGKLAPHRPRWFYAETDGDTGERVWTPSRVGGRLEYWSERERVWKEGGTMKVEWKDVIPIFIKGDADADARDAR